MNMKERRPKQVWRYPGTAIGLYISLATADDVAGLEACHLTCICKVSAEHPMKSNEI